MLPYMEIIYIGTKRYFKCRNRVKEVCDSLGVSIVTNTCLYVCVCVSVSVCVSVGVWGCM